MNHTRCVSKFRSRF